MIPKQCIIIGGGESIKEGLSSNLKEQIKDKFVVAINFACHHFDNTFTTFCDKKIWTGKLMGEHTAPIDQNHLKIIQKQLLIITISSSKITPTDSLLVLEKNDRYLREMSLNKGFYMGHLTGVFAITVASFLMNYVGEIFLLGYDFTKKTAKNPIPATHYYTKEEINHRGQEQTFFYNTHKGDNIFKMFIEQNLKMYNVSMTSTIDCFEKITYEQMYSKLDTGIFNQDILRQEIKTKLKK
jgi:hypothetical protein